MTAKAEGLLLVDKPRGWTSHDVVAVVRKLLPRDTKVGHSGTLDPLATGLLVLLVGRATKSAARLQGLAKVYSGHLRFGIETETLDLEGRILHEAPVPELPREDLQKLFAGYVGECELPIPAYSAVKHQGRPLYKYARKGIVTPPKIRTSVIHDLTLLDWTPPEASFRMRCSSGTYVRAFASDAGKKIGCGAVLSSLCRESVGAFTLAGSRTIEQLRTAGKDGPDGVLNMLQALEPAAANA
ncbi:MAG: tRNA pseudouridine(55) synthase TruB [Elusimicrobiota bacterium]